MFSFFKKKNKEDEIKVEEVQEEQKLSQTELKDEAYANPIELKEEELKVEEVIKSEEIKNEETKEEKKGFFSRALEKTFASIKTVVPQRQEKISFDDIEELLIEADMEYEIIEKAMNGLPPEITRKQLRHRLVMLFEHAPKVDLSNLPKPFVRLIIGVNGAGKTTTIAKLANKTKKEGKSVILGAGDTFRAAAIEQLSTWASKIDVPIIKTKQGHDASAVAFDTISAAISRNIDNVIIDTAGRLQTQTNLNNELKKIVRVCSKAMPDAPHQKLMILDGTQGNTAIAQARAFNEMVGIDGIIVTKLDGTAKGGALFSISNQLELPIFYVGIGEKQDDLIEFSPDDFVDSLLDQIYTEEK
uniref:signal recognition particle-docking protein FtsY n=1 Tax=Aliarcobacter sp. TaxID=2321116 RepID=UPI004047B527